MNEQEEMMEALQEQIRAAQETSHFYTCFVCRHNKGHRPVVIGIEENDGIRAIVVVICQECDGEYDGKEYAGMVH